MDGNYRERPAQELHPIRRVKAAQTAAWLVSLDEDRHAAIEIMQCVPAFPRLSSPRAHASIRIVTCCARHCAARSRRSEEHTSELQSLMRISYAVFCLKQK